MFLKTKKIKPIEPYFENLERVKQLYREYQSSANLLRNQLEIYELSKQLLLVVKFKVSKKKIIKILNEFLSKECKTFMNNPKNLLFKEMVRELVYNNRKNVLHFKYFYQNIFEQDLYDCKKIKSTFNKFKNSASIGPQYYYIYLIDFCKYLTRNRQFLINSKKGRLQINEILFINAIDNKSIRRYYKILFPEERINEVGWDEIDSTHEINPSAPQLEIEGLPETYM